MSFQFIFLTLFIAGWAICGVFPWLVASVLTRGSAGLVFLPISMATAVLFGMLVPFLGGTGVTGIWLSFGVAVAGPSLLTGRASRGVGRALRHHGFELIAEPESFLVSRENLLVPGERERARQWGAGLAETIVSAGAPPSH